MIILKIFAVTLLFILLFILLINSDDKINKYIINKVVEPIADIYIFITDKEWKSKKQPPEELKNEKWTPEEIEYRNNRIKASTNDPRKFLTPEEIEYYNNSSIEAEPFCNLRDFIPYIKEMYAEHFKEQQKLVRNEKLKKLNNLYAKRMF
jgi:hypothetical protein